MLQFLDHLIISQAFPRKIYSCWVRWLANCSSPWGQLAMLYIEFHPMIAERNHGLGKLHDWKESRTLNSQANTLTGELKSKTSEDGEYWLLNELIHFQMQINWFQDWDNDLWRMNYWLRYWKSWKGYKSEMVIKWEVISSSKHPLSIQIRIYLGQMYTESIHEE